MTGILAIETSTDVCSVAVQVDGELRERHQHAPQQHNRLLFEMLRELLSEGDLRQQGIEAVTFGSGPGSFTGLRIAASAAQGLAFASELPVIGVSSLAALAQAALRTGLVTEGDRLLCTLDARINEIYSAVYGFDDGLAALLAGPDVGAPEALNVGIEGVAVGVGNGLRFVQAFPAEVAAALGQREGELMPLARDLLPLAAAEFARDAVQPPGQAQPLYVREEVNWKKIPEQGKRK